MFPNLRLTVVAILAAITGIGCGLGLFATFRVNHEPLARLAEGSPPLQLAFDRLGLNSQPEMPLEARLPINSAAKAIPVPVIETPRADDVEARGPVSADPGNVQPVAGGTPETDPISAANVSPVVPPAQSIAMHEDSVATSSQPDAVTAAGEQQLSAPPSAPVASNSAPAAQQIATVNAAAPDEQPIAPPSAPVGSDQARPSAEQTAIDAAAVVDQPSAAPSAPAAAPADVPRAEQTAAINAAAATDHETPHERAEKPAKSAEKKTAKPATRAARAAPARRVAKIVRARRTVAAVAPQTASQYSQTTYTQTTYAQSAYTQSTYTQPTYGWANSTQQAAVTRVQIKRHRAARKPAPTAQINPLPATAGLSGGQ